MHNLPAIVAEWLIVLFIAALGILVLAGIVTGKIPLDGLLAETGTPPKASMSRLQLLLFTITIIGLWLSLSLEAGEFVEIPNQVLGLLGISGGSYVVSKAIQMGNKKPE